MREYDFQTIEKKWQDYWEKTGLFHMDPASPKEKFYCLVMFPYPSGVLHVGHLRNYVIGDVLARYKLIRGFNVLTPIGWDAFGLPAENAAIKADIHPAIYTRQNIDAMKRQIPSWGVGYDWDREVNSSEAEYYKWTQWVFLKVHEAGLAYKKKAPVNWCESCATALANEEVVDGRCERCGEETEKRDLAQWFFKITEYAQRLLDDLALLDKWPEKVRTMQSEWIGRSEGARIEFKVAETGDPMPCFTTRPDTLWGVTFMSLAAEHPIIEKLVKGKPHEKDVLEFCRRVKKESLVERTAEAGKKEGVFTGCHVINPVNGEKVPLWVANYALMEYGTGAVMAVPAHDQRDFEFAKQYNLGIRVVIQPKDKELDPKTMTEAYVDDGIQTNSAQFTGMPNREALPKIIDWLDAEKRGGRMINYRIRDWLISRQRYWGAPVPMVHCADCGLVPVPENDLPVRLPPDCDFKAKTIESPLASVPEFVNTTCPRCGKPAKRETDTIAQWLCSCWYFLRYLSPHDEDKPYDRALADKWLPVDQYIGGIEHAVLHLLYTRFIIKVLYDQNLVGFKEPFAALFTQGMICKDAYRCGRHGHIHESELANGKCPKCGEAVETKVEKMSKSKYNVVDPGPVIDKFGTDTVRLYALFIGPPQKDATWDDRAVVGAHRFLSRLWTIVAAHSKTFEEAPISVVTLNDVSGDAACEDLFRKIHQTIRKVTDDIEQSWHFNTAIAKIMELVNAIEGFDPKASDKAFGVFRFALETTVQLLSPFAPHIAEELWSRLGREDGIFRAQWPTYDAAAAAEEEIEIPIQVNGKLRSKIAVSADLSDADLEAAALADEKVAKFTEGKTVRKVIVVPKKLVNVVAK
ncbi:MAG: leucine--tRNA ligase [Planctomycetes bacterium]|nr:leucine--tRNA ligase [Planctomycetota bacterium]